MKHDAQTHRPAPNAALTDLGQCLAPEGTVTVTRGGEPLGRRLLALLVESGLHTQALVRTRDEAAAVTACGVEARTSDLGDPVELAAILGGQEAVVHVAVGFAPTRASDELYRDEVMAVGHLIEAARAAGVRRLAHVGAAAVVKNGGPVRDADETRPRRTPRHSPYVTAQSLAEERVLAANGAGLETVVARLPLVWGPGLEGVLSEMDRWCLGDARYPYSTCHVENAARGVLAVLGRGEPGQTYFIADEDTVELGEFLRQLRSRSVSDQPTLVRSASRVWTCLRHPRHALRMRYLLGSELTVSDARARTELGYVPVVSRAAGLRELDAARDR